MIEPKTEERYQILCDGKPYGPSWTWRNPVVEHVQVCRRVMPRWRWDVLDRETGLLIDTEG